MEWRKLPLEIQTALIEHYKIVMTDNATTEQLWRMIQLDEFLNSRNIDYTVYDVPNKKLIKPTYRFLDNGELYA